jgi:hypothetical protein
VHVITGPKTGVLCSRPDRDALAAGLREMLALQDSWPEVGARARRRIQGFTAASTANGYRELYVRWLSET